MTRRMLPRNQPFVKSYHQTNSNLPGQFMMRLMPAAAAILALQAASSPPPPTAPNATTAMARRAATPPLIDGKDNDDVWRLAPVIKDFRQFQPTEDADPSFPTEAKRSEERRVGKECRSRWSP